MKVFIPLCALSLALAGCTGGTDGDYDPDWDPNGPIEDGKADGLMDFAPQLQFGQPAEGDVGGQNMEVFWIDLQRTDRIAVTLEVLSGDLNPHISLFYGTSTYIHSESWNRDGDALTKEYLIESAGSHLIAVRAYQGQGSGRYRVTATCLGGPCNGEFPEPEHPLDVDQVAECIQQARRCSFEALPGYGGRVGEFYAAQIFNNCIGQASLDDGASCATACEWTDDDDNGTWGDAIGLCNDITQSLIFYADQTAACLSLLDSCISDCYDAGEYGYGYDDGELYSTVESLCWADGFNGTCDGHAREHEACGGTIVTDSAGECVSLCHSTTGAHIDDLDTLCGYDSDCEDYCDVDIARAAEICGGLIAENESCLWDYLDENQGWICEEALEEAL